MVAEPGTSLLGFTDRQVRVISAPLATVTEQLFETLGHPMGSPPEWQAALRSALEPCDMALLEPVYGADAPWFIPDCLVPRPDGLRSSFDDELHRMAEEAFSTLECELDASGFARSGPWALVAKHPRRWLDAYLVAVQRGWQAVKPLWARATPLIEREAERVGASLARGGFPHLMAGLSPRGRVENDRWYIPNMDGTATVIDDGLALQPMIIGQRALFVSEKNGAIVQLYYPLPGAHRLLTDVEPRGHDTPLGALLGPPRADILRRLDQPATAGELATGMAYARSAITHHLDTLERAELATRERQGRHVIVRRTARGTALLHLYEP